MDFIKRLFTRKRSSALDITHSRQPAAVTKKPTTVGGVTVPPDHRVTCCRPAVTPSVQTLNGGVTIACLGSASDEFMEELAQVFKKIESSLSSSSSNPILVSDGSQQLSDLFHPNDPKLSMSIPGLLYWIVDAGSAHLWLPDPKPLLDAILRARSIRTDGIEITEYVLFSFLRPLALSGFGTKSQELKYPPSTFQLARIFSDAGLNVAAVPDDGVFFIEVSRPDTVLGAMRSKAFPGEHKQGTASPKTACHVDRATRLRRLTLAVIAEPTRTTRHQLINELHSRDIPLLLITDSEHKTKEMNWPGIGRALPVYPDVSSLLQAAEDLKMPQGSFGMTAYSPHELFQLVANQGTSCVALNVYQDRSTPHYAIIAKEEIAALARGEMPT